ncbi:MAG: IS3 family transposase, partial [Magnetovibrio sp.]|nr:IS3 family transposase [Magnetovibrio sp.]
PGETFFKTLKAELVWRTRFETRLQAETLIRNYINTFYNSRRRQSFLGNIRPMRSENMAV